MRSGQVVVLLFMVFANFFVFPAVADPAHSCFVEVRNSEVPEIREGDMLSCYQKLRLEKHQYIRIDTKPNECTEKAGSFKIGFRHKGYDGTACEWLRRRGCDNRRHAAVRIPAPTPEKGPCR